MLVNETFTQKIPTILAPTGSVYYMYMYDVGQKEAYTINVDIRTCLQSANLHGVSLPCTCNNTCLHKGLATRVSQLQLFYTFVK